MNKKYLRNIISSLDLDAITTKDLKSGNDFPFSVSFSQLDHIRALRKSQ